MGLVSSLGKEKISQCTDPTKVVTDIPPLLDCHLDPNRMTSHRPTGKQTSEPC